MLLLEGACLSASHVCLGPGSALPTQSKQASGGDAAP